MAVINIVGTVTSVAFFSYDIFQMATREKEASATQIGISILILAAEPAAGKVAKIFYVKYASTTANAIAPSMIKDNVNIIRRADQVVS